MPCIVISHYCDIRIPRKIHKLRIAGELHCDLKRGFYMKDILPGNIILHVCIFLVVTRALAGVFDGQYHYFIAINQVANILYLIWVHFVS